MSIASRLVRCALIAALASVTGCFSDYDVADELLLARHDAAKDRLDFLVIDRGLAAAGNAEQVAAIASDLASIRAGGSVFLLPNEFMFRLGGTNVWRMDAKEPSDGELAAVFRTHGSALDGGLFTDEAGHLAVWQHFRIDGARAFLAASNHHLSKIVLDNLDKSEGVPPTGERNPYDDDPATRELLRRVVRLTAGNARLTSAKNSEASASAADDAERAFVPLLAQVNSVEHDGRALRLRAGRDGELELEFHTEPRGDDASLRARLGAAVDAKHTVDELKQAFEARCRAEH